MDIIEILVLGFIQGIAEFLPLSFFVFFIIFRDVFGIGVGISANMVF